MPTATMEEHIKQACKAALEDASATRIIYRNTKLDFVISIDRGFVKGVFRWLEEDHPDFLEGMPPFLQFGSIIDANSRWREGNYNCKVKGKKRKRHATITFKPRRVRQY